MSRWAGLAIPLQLVLLLVVAAAVVVISADVGPSVDGWVEGSSDARACTVDDLIPLQGRGGSGGSGGDGGNVSDMWDEGALVPPPFNCTCTTLKASYHCPHLGTEGYPRWSPRAVADGSCRSKDRGDLKDEPFPPGFRILFYGNSHLRQVVEGIVCAYSHTLQSRRLNVVDVVDMMARDVNVAVAPDLQCRSCVSSPLTMSNFLLENDCVSQDAVERACRCHDNESLFLFDNGALLHYHFAHMEDDKKIEDALEVHGTRFSDYDAVVANPGNKPNMEVNRTRR